MKYVIGLIGEIASGKGAACEHISKKYAASSYSFSDILRDILYRIHLTNTRENLQSLGVAIRASFGDGILADCLREDVIEDHTDIIVVDGVRYPYEVDMIRSFEHNLLIYVSAPQEIRYKRCISRGTRGEKKITLEEFAVSESGATEGKISAIAKKADVVVENTTTLDEFYQKIDDILNSKIL